MQTTTVDDFIKRFGGQGTADEGQASQYYDRFASTHEGDRDFKNEALYDGATQYLGRLDDQEFTKASHAAFKEAPPAAKTSLLQTLLGGLQGRGTDIGGLAGQLGLGSTNPEQMDANDYSRLANYARRNQPDVMRETVQQQPWFVKAMGSPVLMGALTMAAAHLLKKSRH
jgi:hypothetical protein